MQMGNEDLLLQLIDERLLDSRNLHQTFDELTHDVVGEYIYHLMLIGNIPHQHLDNLEADVTEEVNDIIRIKTYGSMSLRDFRLTKMHLK